MAEILIKGGDTDAAANELASALRDIFAIDPLRTTIASATAPGTRSMVELALICLALPPAAIGTADIVARMQLGQRLQRLIARVAALRKTNRASVLIDPGDGKPIPLEEASRDAIIAALQAVEQRLKP
jgi:hypothetical protein